MAKKKGACQGGCDCIRLTNEALEREGHNAELDTEMEFNFQTKTARLVMKLPLRKREPRGKKLPLVLAAYCPICGKKVQA